MTERKKFKIYKDGEEIKCNKHNMIVMNQSGVFFLVSGIQDYYTNIQKLSDVIGYYDVVWKEY